MSFLTSKDDNLLVLISNLILTIVRNDLVSKDVLEYCGLLTKQMDE